LSNEGRPTSVNNKTGNAHSGGVKIASAFARTTTSSASNAVVCLRAANRACSGGLRGELWRNAEDVVVEVDE
jgi:hypothetical protein